MRQLISLKEAMDILQIRSTKIREIACTDPTFPAYMIGNRWKVDAQKLDEWIEDQKIGSKVGQAPKAPQARRGRPPAPPPKQKWEAITPGWSRDKGKASG